MIFARRPLAALLFAACGIAFGVPAAAQNTSPTLARIGAAKAINVASPDSLRPSR